MYPPQTESQTESQTVYVRADFTTRKWNLETEVSEIYTHALQTLVTMQQFQRLHMASSNHRTNRGAISLFTFSQQASTNYTAYDEYNP